MLRKTFSTLTLIFFLAIGLFAQNRDQITLKNGSIIRGTLIKLIPEENVTIDDKAGNTWVFPMSEVEKIEEIKPDFGFNSNFSSGLVNMTSIGFLAGAQNSQYIAPFSMQTSTGYMTSTGLYSGFLIGLEYLNVNHIPVMLDIQYALKNGSVMPVLIARGGYALPTKFEKDYYGTMYNYKGGITGAVGVGLKLKNREGFAWDVSLLYRYMQISYSENYEWQEYENEYKDIYNRMEIRVGFYLGGE